MLSRTQFSYSGFYASKYVVLGILLPFFSGWLHQKGFSAAQIGLLFGIAAFLRIALGPTVAFLADKTNRPIEAVGLVSAVYGISTLVLLFPIPNAVIAMASVLVSLAFGLLVPMSDAAMMRADRMGLLHYGQIRAVGSGAFLLTNIVGGLILSRYGLGAGVYLMALGGLGTFLFSLALALPAEKASGSSKAVDEEACVGDNSGGIGAIIRNRQFLIMVFAAGLVQAAHSVYYNFSAIHWTGIGYSPQLIGYLWAFGVVVEISILIYARRIAKRLSPALLIGLGAFAALIRWPLTALEPPIAVLFGLQALHALTFSATYLGALEYVDRYIPARYRVSAMALSATVGIGALSAVATMGAGQLFHAAGAMQAYLLMAGMAFVALGLAWLLWGQIAKRANDPLVINTPLTK